MNIFKSFSDTKGALLPLLSSFARPCGKAVSALFLLLAVNAQADDSVRQQVENALAKTQQQWVAAQAKQQGWPTPQVQLQHELPSKLPAQVCSQPLSVQRHGDDPSVLVRQRFVLSCVDGWKVNATSQATVLVNVVFASVPLERGQSLSAADVKLQPVNIAKATRGYFVSLDQVVGLGAKRRIRDGQQLTPGLLTGAVVVKRGQQVEIRASQDGIQARAVGEALGNGQLGEVIRVRNLGSEKVIDAKVIEPGVVSSTYR